MDGSINRTHSSIWAFFKSLNVYTGTRHPDMASFPDKNTFYAWQRNHMANERTFLAWCRTGISFIVFGFVIERFDILIRELQVLSTHPGITLPMRSTRYIGMTVFSLGAAIILLAGWRFFCIRKHINRGETDFSVLPDVFLMGAVLATVAATLVFFGFVF